MRITRVTLAFAALLMAIVVGGCQKEAETAKDSGTAEPSARRAEPGQKAVESSVEGAGKQGEEKSGEHAREGSAEHGGKGSGESAERASVEHGKEGEESGTEYALNQTYDNVRNGARLILSEARSKHAVTIRCERLTNP
jgi:hypothetical protein